MKGDGYTLLWFTWLVLFFLIEIPAWLDRKEGGTLSEHLWAIFGLRGKPPYWRLRRAIFAVLVVMLGYHLANGGGWFIVD